MRRTLCSLLAAGFALAALTASPSLGAGAPARADARLDRVERAVVARVNAVRRREGLRRLRSSHGLAAAADHKVFEVLSSGQLSHASPDGTSMQTRVRRYVRAKRVGETIGWISRATRRQAAAVVRAWMASPGHRAALLDPRFRRIGVARRGGRLAGGDVVLFTAALASAR
jgi:uncharacterized protein YkwD